MAEVTASIRPDAVEVITIRFEPWIPRFRLLHEYDGRSRVVDELAGTAMFSYTPSGGGKWAAAQTAGVRQLKIQFPKRRR